METNIVHTGDARDVLADLPESSVHMVMTSPPYFGLRDYGHDEQIGLEDSLDEYISELVQIFREIRRVLRPDGSAWLNLGDSYAQSGRSNHDKGGTAPDGQGHKRGHDAGAFGPKNKMLVPHRVAIALQKDGWIVRNDVTWVKPNPMPQSVKDRLNTTTEQVFHLTTNPDYWYDLDAIREPHAAPDRTAGKRKEYKQYGGGQDERYEQHPAGKNPGDVFEVTTKPFPDAHFAVYPPDLCEKPIKATCPPDGIVLDPFAGAGTTLLKAKELGRNYVGIELNPRYADMARKRVGLDLKDPSNARDDDSQTGIERFS